MGLLSVHSHRRSFGAVDAKADKLVLEKNAREPGCNPDIVTALRRDSDGGLPETGDVRR